MSTNAIASVLTNQFVSGIDALAPDVYTRLVRRYGDQGGEFFRMLRLMSAEMVVSNVDFDWFEEDRMHETIIVDANVAQPIVGADIVFTLAPASVDANNNFYPRLGDLILFKNEVTGYVADINTTTPTAPIITVRLQDETEQFPALTAGELLVIFSGMFSEGSGQPKSAIDKVDRIQNSTQIIKETLTYTGTAATDMTWLRFDGKNGTQQLPGDPYYVKEQASVDYRMELKISGALLFGKKTNNTAAIDPDTGRPYRSTQGLIPAIRERGNRKLHVPGTWTISDFDDMDRIFDREGASSYVLGLMGINFQQENNNVLADYFKNTNIEMAVRRASTELFAGNESMQATANFEYLQKNGRCFLFRRMPEFSNPKLYGANGYPMPNYAVFVPYGETNVKMGDGSSKKLKSLTVRYKGLGQYNRKSEVWRIGSLGPTKLIDADQESTYMRTDLGLMATAMNQAVLVATQ